MIKLLRDPSEDEERRLSECLRHDVAGFLAGDSDDDFVFVSTFRNALSARVAASQRSRTFLGVGYGALATAALLIVAGVVWKHFQSAPVPSEQRAPEWTSVKLPKEADDDAYWTPDRVYAMGVEKINSASNMILTEAIDPIANLPDLFLDWQDAAFESLSLSDPEISKSGNDEADRYSDENDVASSTELMDTRDFIRASWNVGSLVLALERFYEE